MRFAKIKILVICLLIIFNFGISSNAEETDFELHLLDVGQGLSILVKVDDHYLLYDGGGAKTSSFVVSYLRTQGVIDLDYIVVSHYDEDHLNGIIGALHAFDCATVLAPDYIPDTDIYASYISAIQKKGVSVIYPEKGDVYTLGNASIVIVGPTSYNNASENNNCISLYIEYGDFRYLLCGDMESEGEEDIINSNDDMSCDLYVVNHHGSASSSSFYFLNHVLPKYALLSCGAYNAYNHPSVETMERLRNIDCELYRTDKQGTIIAYSDGNTLWFNVAPSTDWSGGSSLGGGDIAGVTSLGSTTYVCNMNTYKFHYEYCDSVNKMKEENKMITNESRDTLIAQGFEPCKNCCP